MKKRLLLSFVTLFCVLKSFSQYSDSILFFKNSNFQTTTVGTGANGDYVQLPTLDMNGKYTIETWFKNTGILGDWRRVFDFGSGSNSSGVLLGFPTDTSVGYHSNGTDIIARLPANFSTNGWNHIALSFDGTNLRLYLNGALISTNAAQPIAAATCTSNFIARSNWPNDGTTRGEFQEFRIWKKARTASEIQSTMQFPIQLAPNNNDSLYYYLPLTKTNTTYPIQTINIPNNTTIPNLSTWTGRLNTAATINSQNGAGAKYYFDSTNQQLSGTYSGSLQSNEKIQYTINNGINWNNVDTALGNLWVVTFPSNFRYGTIKIRGSINNVATNRFFNSYSVHRLYDSIFGFYNSSFQTTTAGTGGAGDYVQLPTLDMSGKYTIETWFKNTGTLGSWNRLIDFGSGGVNNGVLIGFPLSNRIGYLSNGNPKEINLPINFNINGWNHIALTFDGTRLRLYINGILIDSNSGGSVNAIAANTCTSNFIGRSNFSIDAATQGLFQEFRIWKKVRTASEIQSALNFPIQLVPNNNDSLYYYLTLTNSISNNPVQTVNIPNNTTLTNSSNWSGRVNSAATINSQNDSGAKYVFYDTSQKVFGTFLDTLQSNEKLQISIDAGLTWKNVDTAFNNQWIATLPSNFRTGIIQARGSINNTATYRTFSNNTFVIAPVITYQYNRIDTFLGTIGIVDSVININYRGRVSSLMYRITSGNVNGINIDSLNGNISLDARLNVGYYPITITASNQVGSTLINIIINIQPIIDTIVGFSNSVFQTTTPGIGGNGDYITLPYLNIGNRYTVETWYRNTGTLGGWNRVFDICGGQVSQPGIQVSFSTPNELKVSVQGHYETIALPAIFNRNDWNHIALSLDGANGGRFYINGVFIQTIPIFTAVNLNTCPTNFIGRSYTNSDSSTLAQFRDFRIWKKVKTISEIQANMQSIILQPDDSLFYYLPLTNTNRNNPLSTLNIPNNTMLTNTALWSGRETNASTITSQNNSGAKYAFNDSSQKIYGIYARDLQPNEKIQFSTDTGRTWINVDTAFGNQWIATLPPNFRYGVIRVRGSINNVATNRVFSNYNFRLVPSITYQYNRIDTFLGTIGTIDSIITIERGGSSSVIKYRISNGQVNGINIDSLTGNISLDSRLNAGYYPITISATNEAGSSNNNIIINIKPNIDTIIGFYNSNFQTTTASTGANGDYVLLPTLDMSGSYTIETWFKNTGELGGWRRVFDFGSGANSAGILLGFPSTTQIGFHSNGGDIVTNLPANFSTNGWNHIALSFDGINLRLYLNGVLISTNAGQPVAAATCTSNFIARSNFSTDGTTRGEFQDFRIWKKTLTTSEILSIYATNIIGNNDNLYYYLPLTNANKNNPISTINIPNNTVLNNASLWTGRVTSSATITSQNGTGAKYAFNDSSQKIYGIYARDLQPNEKIQFSTDTGRTWSNVDTAFGNQWVATLPASFRYGVIRVRGFLNNSATNRTFNNYNFRLVPSITYQYNRIDTLAGSSGNINRIVRIDNGGSSNLKFRISNGQVNGINIDSLIGTISLDSRLNAGYYPITVSATNEVGSSNNNIIINIKPIIDSIIGLSNSTFQTTTASAGDGGDYVRLPTLDMSGSYTIETWFKNTGTLGNQKRVFDFGSGANNNGVFVSFPSATQITFLQRNIAFNTNLPADFVSNGWNHIAVSYDSSTVRLYINGVQVNQGNNFLSIDSNTCTSNFIARSNYPNDATTQGEFREFRIWKKARTASEIKSNLQSFIPQPAVSLYYYLPLTNANNNNPIQTLNIPNNTKLNNLSSWSGRVLDSATITSQNNSGAKYAFNDSSQKIYGIYARDLQSNEILQFSLDTGRTWLKVDTAYNNQWVATLPASFRYGIIQVRGYLNNVATNRVFSNYNFRLVPSITYQYNRIDTFAGSSGNINSIVRIDNGGSSNLKFRISNGLVNGINIDSITGTISLDARLNVGYYPITVTATNEVGSSNNSIIINIQPIINTIIGLSNSVFQTTTASIGGGGDYVQLPTLDMSGSYTIETWFKNTGALGSWRRVFDFGSGQNSNGVLLGFPSSTQIGFHSNGGDIVTNLPANFSANGWNHIVLTFDGTNLRLYLNGVLIITNAGQPVAAATCTSNFIARSNWTNDGTTRGQFRDFRIWKKARTASEILSNINSIIPQPDDSLYYYLPLTYTSTNNPLSTINIPNNTVLNNNAIWQGKLNGSSVITSQNNSGAKYAFNDSAQKIYGYYYRDLLNNEKIQFSIDTGRTWINSDTAIYNRWIATLPSNFRMGIIQVRGAINNTATNRFFTNDTFLIAPDIRYQFNTIDTIEGTIGIIDRVLSIDYRGRFSALKYRISSGQVNGINIDSMNGTISLDARLFAGFYPITVTATNQIGSTNINLNINVRFVNRNVILSFYNNSLQTTTEGTGGNGDYVQLPALDMSGSYTIETWFKNTGILGGWRRLFDFGSGPNGNGVLFGFPTDTLIGYHSNGADIVINLPANFSTNGWNHIALSFDNTNLRLYLNGVLISTNAAQPIAAATCTSNFIARSNYPNDGTTRGEFQDFRIWKKARTASEIQNGLRTSVLVNSDSLYYYLPLVKPNIAYNSNINNGTNINNASTTTLALRLPSTITSQANIGARYSYDTNRQRLFGTISDTLRSNEKIQFSIDTGRTWTNVDTVIGLNWIATIPANFLWGEIRVRSDSNITRVFNIYTHYIAPDFTYSPNNTVDTFGTSGTSILPTILTSGTTTFAITSGMKAGISINANSGQISWMDTLSLGSYNLTITANNQYGSDTAKFTLIIAQPLTNLVYSIDSVSFEFGNAGSSVLPTITGSPAPTYTISPAPNGLSINSNTGLIQWTSVFYPSDYRFTVTATNIISSISTLYKIRVIGGDSIKGFTYNQDTVVLANFGTAGASNTPTRTSGNPAPKYRFSPTTPAPNGITIDSVTGVIHWSNMAPVGIYSFKVIASNVLNTDSSQMFRLSIRSLKPVISYPINTIIAEQNIADSSVTPALNATGLPITFTIDSGAINGISINSLTGVIKWTKYIPAGNYNLTIKAKNIVYSGQTNFTLVIIPTYDTVLYFSNSALLTTTTTGSPNNDKIILPNNLNLNGEFTIELWHKSDVTSFNYNSFLDFRTSAGGTSGFFAEIVNNNSLQVYCNSGAQNFSVPAGFNWNIWHHYAFVRNYANQLSLYIDGTLIATRTVGNIASNATTNNFIGSGNNLNSNPERGLYQEFRIWKKARSTQDIQASFKGTVLRSSDALYYYLPLDQKLFDTRNIADSTTLANYATATGALNGVSIITSRNNGTGAKYIVDSNRQRLSGRYKDSLKTGETIQVSYDSGLNWKAVTYAANYYWYDSALTMFYGGRIKVRSVINDVVTTRLFTDFVQYLIPSAPSKPLNVLAIPGNTRATIRFNKPLQIGGLPLVKYIIQVAGGTKIDSLYSSAISNDISFSGLLNGVTYRFSVKAINNFGLESDTALSNMVELDSNLRQITTESINGTITRDTAIRFGNNITITYSPNTGYELDSIYINGIYSRRVTADSTTSYTFYNVLGDSSIRVVNKIRYFTINASVKNGSITPSGVTTYNYGTNQTFTFNPTNSNYILDSLVIDGVLQPNPTGNSYTFNNIQTNHSIYVVYAFVYNINITSNNGGVLNPSTSQQVKPGTSLRVSWFALSGYIVDSVYINGVINRDSLTGFTFTNVQTDQTLRVVFKQKAVLPNNNFNISVTQPNCVLSQGTLNITANVTGYYKLSLLTQSGQNILDSFRGLTYSKTLTDTGLYKLSISLKDTSVTNGINRYFEFTIKYPKPITAYSELESQDRVLTLSLAGATKYDIWLNGQLFSTELSTLKLPLQTGVNNVVIKSDKQCQDSITKTILISESVTLYPNPVKDYVNINVGGTDKELEIAIYNNYGQLVISKNVSIDESRNITVDTRLLKPGVYYVKLKGNAVFGTYSILKGE